MHATMEESQKVAGKLNKKEETKEGAVTCGVYTSYAVMVGIPTTMLIFLLVVSMNGGQVMVEHFFK